MKHIISWLFTFLRSEAMNNSMKEISFNILGGLIAGLITLGVVALGKKITFLLNRRKFRCLFGTDVLIGPSFHLVYAHLSLRTLRDENGNIVAHPYVKPGEEMSGACFSVDRTVSSCEVRAAKYLSEGISVESRQSPKLSSDYDIRERLDISFVSFGGPKSNYKTRDAIENDGNQLIKLDNNNFLSKKSGRIISNRKQGFDHGLILKIHPAQFPKRVWLVCAGIGEWGTSGAAWYLAHKWKDIYDYAKHKPFAIIVRVKTGVNPQDESAEPIVKLKYSIDAEQYANMIEKSQK